MTKSQTQKSHKPRPLFSKKLIIIIVIIVPLILAGVAGFFIWQSRSKLSLDPEYYNQAEIKAVPIEELEEFAAAGKSFAVFVSQPNCRTADDLRRILDEFSEQYRLTVYEVSFSELKESQLAPEVKYYPSFILFRKGKVESFLRANSSEDSDAYNSLAGFSEWFRAHTKLPHSSR